jgi:hypothetical protein
VPGLTSARRFQSTGSLKVVIPHSSFHRLQSNRKTKKVIDPVVAIPLNLKRSKGSVGHRIDKNTEDTSFTLSNHQMTKLSTVVQIIVSVMVVTAFVAVSWDSSKQQSESKRSLRVGKERKLQNPVFPPFPGFSATTFTSSAFTLPPLPAFNPGMLSIPTGGNDNTFSEIAGGRGGGMSTSMGGGSAGPVVVGGANLFQITTFGGDATNTAGGFGVGVVGEAPNLEFFSNVPGFNTVPAVP